MEALFFLAVVLLAGGLSLLGVWAWSQAQSLDAAALQRRMADLGVERRMAEIRELHPEWSSLQVLQAAESNL